MENRDAAKDHLNFRNDPEIKKQIGNEELLLSDKLIKVNRYGLSQERNIVVTNQCIYNFKKKSKKYLYNIIYLINYRHEKKNSSENNIRNNCK